GKQGLGFGSYGWYRNTVSSINQKLVEAGITLCDETILSQNYTPSTEDLDQYSAWGMELGNKIMNQSK
ncbi:MAG: FprA family A-type flavoprotein, partial [Erysipelotrichaceae bacterium]|nr:FprA family A-type flavoprotein [Erysipelotrichaceae bacterium]